MEIGMAGTKLPPKSPVSSAPGHGASTTLRRREPGLRERSRPSSMPGSMPGSMHTHLTVAA